ncbi:MAG: RDD family protein [Mariprofundales bacterium]
MITTTDTHQGRPRAKEASIFIRIGASVYDSFILFGLAFLTFGIVTFLEYQFGSEAPQWAKTLLVITVTYAYFIGFWINGGATTGMRAWKLQVAMVDSGDNITLLAATMRFFTFILTWLAIAVLSFTILRHTPLPLAVYIASTLLPLGSLVCMLITKKNQPLHDLLAGTNVFRVLDE